MVPAEGPPVYLAHFDEDNYTSPQYQSIVRTTEDPQTISESQSLLSTMTSTQNFLPPESSTSRKRPRSPGEEQLPILKLARTDMGWKVSQINTLQPNNNFSV